MSSLIFKLQLGKCNHLSRQERIPVALYTREKIMDYYIAIDEVKPIIWKMFFKINPVLCSSSRWRTQTRSIKVWKWPMYGILWRVIFKHLGYENEFYSPYSNNEKFLSVRCSWRLCGWILPKVFLFLPQGSHPNLSHPTKPQKNLTFYWNCCKLPNLTFSEVFIS